MSLCDDGGVWGVIGTSDTKSTAASECAGSFCVHADVDVQKRQLPVGIKLYHCWACGSLRLDPHGGCSGTNHQLRRSTCDSKPVTKEYVEFRRHSDVRYFSRRLDSRFEGWHKAYHAALEDVLYKRKRLEQLDAVREQIAALKMQETNLEDELYSL